LIIKNFGNYEKKCEVMEINEKIKKKLKNILNYSYKVLFKTIFIQTFFYFLQLWRYSLGKHYNQFSSNRCCTP